MSWEELETGIQFWTQPHIFHNIQFCLEMTLFQFFIFPCLKPLCKKCVTFEKLKQSAPKLYLNYLIFCNNTHQAEQITQCLFPIFTIFNLKFIKCLIIS